MYLFIIGVKKGLSVVSTSGGGFEQITPDKKVLRKSFNAWKWWNQDSQLEGNSEVGNLMLSLRNCGLSLEFVSSGDPLQAEGATSWSHRWAKKRFGEKIRNQYFFPPSSFWRVPLYYKDNCRPSPRQLPDVQPAHVNSAVPFFWILVSFWQVKSSSVDCPTQIC